MPNDGQYWISSLFGGFGKFPVPKCFLTLRKQYCIHDVRKHEYVPSVSPNLSKTKRSKHTWLLCLLNHLAMWLGSYSVWSWCGSDPWARACNRVILCPCDQGASIQVRLLFGSGKVLHSSSCTCYSCGPWIEGRNSALV